MRLNGQEVYPPLAALMHRPDWQGERTDKCWLDRFPAHPLAKTKIPFIQLCGEEWAIRENEAYADPDLSHLNGQKDGYVSPGYVDPASSYLIGFTDYCDSAICVDLRPTKGASIVYECHAPKNGAYATAFSSLDEFIEFYIRANNCS